MSAGKNTYSDSALWQPDLEPANSTSKLIASSGVEVVNLKLTSGVNAAHIDLYDTNSAQGAVAANLRWFMDVNPAGSDSDHFDYPLYFAKGIYAVLTQGTGGNPQFGVGYIPSKV